MAPALRDLMLKGSLRRARDGLGGSHTVVTYPPLDALEASDGGSIQVGPSERAINLYFHVAFCEYMCPFCHYAKVYAGVDRDTERVTKYVDSLLKEIDLRKAQLGRTPVETIYIGGGTPTSLSIGLLDRLVSKTLSLCPLPPSQFCVETSPMTVLSRQGREKLRLLQSFGVNRFSVGIQTFDNETLRRFRGHGYADAVSAVGHLVGTGAELNIDMMQDLPPQSRANIDFDLECIERLRPPQITWYIFRLHNEAGLYRTYERGDLEGLPSDLESAERRLYINRSMENLGYQIEPGGRFVLTSSGQRDIYKEIRSNSARPLLGFGTSAYSHGWGWFFRNVTERKASSGINEYIDRMQSGRSPIGYAMQLSPDEIIASRLVHGVRSGIDPAWFDSDDSTTTAIAATINQLMAAGALETGRDGDVVLSELGLVFEEEIASLLYSPLIRRRLTTLGAYWAGCGSGVAGAPLKPYEVQLFRTSKR